MAEDEGSGDETKTLAIIATKGTLDMAYPPLILASTAVSFGWDVMIFYTFWGLDVLHEDKHDNLKVSPVGNPGMTVPGTDVMMPNIVGGLPGMTSMATKMMKGRIEDENIASVEDLLDVCSASGVDLLACQMTMDLFDYEEEDLIEGAEAGVGAATALERMVDADIQLLV